MSTKLTEILKSLKEDDAQDALESLKEKIQEIVDIGEWLESFKDDFSKVDAAEWNYRFKQLGKLAIYLREFNLDTLVKKEEPKEEPAEK